MQPAAPFLQGHRILVPVELRCRASVELVKRVNDELLRPGAELHVVCVLGGAFKPSPAQLAQVKAELHSRFEPLCRGNNGNICQVHVLPVALGCSSYIDVADLKAAAIWALAARLHASVVVLPGNKRRVRDSALLSFLVGRSVRQSLLEHSRTPVYTMREGKIEPATHPLPPPALPAVQHPHKLLLASDVARDVRIGCVAAAA